MAQRKNRVPALRVRNPGLRPRSAGARPRCGGTGRFLAQYVLLPVLLTAVATVVVVGYRRATSPVRAAPRESAPARLAQSAVPGAPVSEPDAPRLTEPPRATAAPVAPTAPAAIHPPRDHLAPELLSPPERVVLWQAGRLDGVPESILSPLAEQEYRVLSSEAPVIVVPRETGSMPRDRTYVEPIFPQTLMPGQTVVVHLPELPRQDLLACAQIAASGRAERWFSLTAQRPCLEVLFNGTLVWNGTLPLHAFPLTALAPAAAMEDYDNTLVLINRGKIPVCFDAAWVEAAAGRRPVLSCSVADWDELPPYARGYFPAAARTERDGAPARKGERPLRPDRRLPLVPITTVGNGLRGASVPLPGTVRYDWDYSACAVGFESQEQTAERFLTGAVGFFCHGGGDLTLSGLTSVGAMFCPRTGRPYPCAYALREFGQLFQGESRLWLPVNVLPAGEAEPPLDRVCWLGTLQGADRATILVAANSDGRLPERVRVVAVLPWAGDTNAAAAVGIFPESLGIRVPCNRAGPDTIPGSDDYDRERSRTNKRLKLGANAAGTGLLDEVFEFRSSLLLELTRAEAAMPGRRAPGPAAFTSRLRRAGRDRAPYITTEREGTSAWLHVLGPAPTLFRSLCANYRVRRGKASKADVAGARHVAPLSGESLFLDISYPDGCPKGAEGMALDLAYFNQPRIAGSTLNLWLMPHVTSKSARQVTLGVVLGNETAEFVVTPGAWQRLVWPLPEFRPGERPYLMVYADRQWPEYRDGSGVVFEFNGCSLLRDAAGTDVRTRWNEGRSRLDVVMRGTPGQEAFFRKFFQDPVRIRKVGALEGLSAEPKWRYDADAQMLEVSGLRGPDREAPRADDSSARTGESGRSRVALALFVELEP